MTSPYLGRIVKGCEQMRHPGLDVLLLSKPSKTFYIMGDSRWCVYTRVSH